MSVDARLRGTLRDQADAFTPHVEDALDRVRARGRLDRWRGSVVAVAASAAAAAAIAGAVVALVAPRQQGAPLERPTASATDTRQAPLRGMITADVHQPDALSGRWTLKLNGNGSIDVVPPPGLAGGATGALFTADSTSFRTTLFQSGLCTSDGTGIYDWLRVGDRIEFQVVSDTCDARSRFLEDSAWWVSTDDDARD